MVCFINQLPVDVWSHVLSLLSWKDIGRLDSAAAGGATRNILHGSIFPRSSEQTFYQVGDKRQTACLWCLNHGMPIRKLDIFCVEEEDRLLEVLALHRGLVRIVSLRCEKRGNLIRTLKEMQKHALDDFVNQSLTCNPNFGLCEEEDGLTAEEKGMCQQLKTLVFEGRNQHQSSGAIAWLTACLQHSPTLETVRLWDVRSQAVKVFQTTAFRSPTLADLSLDRCEVTNALAQCIAETCKQLRSLSICEYGRNDADREDLLSDSGLIAIAKGCQVMEVVCFDHQIGNAAVLEAIAMHCPQLRRLSAARCALSAAALNALATRCPSLTSLSVTWAVDSGVECVAGGLAKLNSLCVTVDSTMQTNIARGLQNVARVCKSLRGLYLNGTWTVPSAHNRGLGAALVAIAKANPNVTSFTLQGLHCRVLDDEHLATIAQCWPKLDWLLINSGLTDAALTAFARHCPELTSLWILDADPQVTDSSVLMLAKHCAKLSYVDLPQAHQVTEEAFTELVRCCPQLTSLVVPATISQEALTRIAAAGNSKLSVSRSYTA